MILSNVNLLQPPESYLLLVRLTNSEDPIITRFLSVPSSFTFAKLHIVLQVAFGWAGCHAHSFDVTKLLKPGEVGPYPHQLPIGAFVLEWSIPC